MALARRSLDPHDRQVRRYRTSPSREGRLPPESRPAQLVPRTRSGQLLPAAAWARAACGNHRDNAIVAKRAGVKTLVLTHLLAQIDLPGIREQIVHEIQQVFDGKVIWGEDLIRLGLSGSRVTSIEPDRADPEQMPHEIVPAPHEVRID